MRAPLPGAGPLAWGSGPLLFRATLHSHDILLLGNYNIRDLKKKKLIMYFYKSIHVVANSRISLYLKAA